MATRKTNSRQSNAKRSAAKTSARSTVSGPARGVAEMQAAADAATAKMQAVQALAAEIPYNANKALEHGEASRQPQAGQTAEPSDPSATASTLTETNASDKAGEGEPPSGFNPGNGPLDRVRVDSGGQALTTNQGVQIADNQNSLKAGLRGPALLEDFILREKITHFDHERIPERIVHARGSGCPRLLRVLRVAREVHARIALCRSGQTHAGVRALLDRDRRARLGGYGARRARLRGQVLHR